MVYCFVVQITPSSLIIKEERNQIFFFFFVWVWKVSIRTEKSLKRQIFDNNMIILFFNLYLQNYESRLWYVYNKIPALVDFSSQKDFIKRQSDWSGERRASYIDVYFAHLRFIPIIPLYIREYLWKIKGKYYIRNISSAEVVISWILLYLWWFGFVWSLFWYTCIY